MQSFKPYVAAISIVLIWSGWITISRYGVQKELMPADITLLRYWTAFICILPLVWKHKWKKFKLHQYLIAGLGVGFPYTLCTFYGLQEIKAAHAGVLVNGMLPVMGALSLYFMFSQKVNLQRWIAILIILAANYMMAGSGLLDMKHLTGIMLMLGAAGVYTMHLTGVKKWAFNWQESLVTVAVVNVVLFTPLWFFMPSNFAGAEIKEILIQSVYQGIIVNIIALMCVAYTVQKLGMITTSMFMSFVPVVTALLAWVTLGEALAARELIGIAGCSAGLLIYARSNRNN